MRHDRQTFNGCPHPKFYPTWSVTTERPFQPCIEVASVFWLCKRIESKYTGRRTDTYRSFSHQEIKSKSGLGPLVRRILHSRRLPKPLRSLLAERRSQLMPRRDDEDVTGVTVSANEPNLESSTSSISTSSGGTNVPKPPTSTKIIRVIRRIQAHRESRRHGMVRQCEPAMHSVLGVQRHDPRLR